MKSASPIGPGLPYTLVSTFFNDGVLVSQVTLLPEKDIRVKDIRHEVVATGAFCHYLHKTRDNHGMGSPWALLPKTGQSVQFSTLTSCLQVFSPKAALAIFTDSGAIHTTAGTDTAVLKVKTIQGDSTTISLAQQMVNDRSSGDGYLLKAKSPFTFRVGLSLAPNRQRHPRWHDLRMFAWIGDENMRGSWVSFMLVCCWSFSSLAFGEQPKVEDRLPEPSPGKVWKLIWNDEFDGTTLDTTKWTYRPEGKRKGGWWSPKAVILDGKGHLVIRTSKDGDKLVDGCITTQGKFERAFGYYVARIQLQRQPGHWSAFWITGPGVHKVGSGGREGTEIDIMEKPWLDERVQHTFHWNGYGKDHKSQGKVVKVPGVMEGFHTFAIWWKPEEYVFYVDGKETWRTKAGGICQVPEYMLLSDEIGTWGGDIAKAQLPDQFLVDYVRVYDLVDKK